MLEIIWQRKNDRERERENVHVCVCVEKRARMSEKGEEQIYVL